MNISGVLKDRKYIEYYYDKDGHLINTQNYQADYNSDFLPILLNDDFNTKTIFEYDSRGRIIKNKIENANLTKEELQCILDKILWDSSDRC